MSGSILINKYRPISFDEMVGHEEVLVALKRALSEPTHPHCFLFTGPGGLGKTTLARIVGTHFECDLLEIDAASNSGVDPMRELVELGTHMSLSGDGNRMIIIDECFAPSSRINTPTGYKRIDTLVPGDLVIGAQGPNRITKIIRNQVDLSRIVCLRLANNCIITCSEDHPFLTSKGWMLAKELVDGKSVCTIQSSIPHRMQEMWDQDYEQGRRHKVLQNLFYENLSRMRQRLLEQCQSLFSYLWVRCGSAQEDGAAIRGMEGIFKGGAAKVSFVRKGQKKSGCFECSYVGEQPHATASYYRQDDGYKDTQWYLSSQNPLAGGQWMGSQQVSTSFVGTGGGRHGISSFNEVAVQEWLSKCLQSGYSYANDKISNRGRRRYSQRRVGSTTRLQKEPMFNCLGVESVSRLQPADIEELRRSGETHFIAGRECLELYDLEVDTHPSYAVEDVIVHNCHTLSKNAWQVLLKITEEPPDHLFIALCTTELSKVPDTIRQRCYKVELRPIGSPAILALLADIADMEGWPVTSEVLQAVVTSSDGSPRKAISILQQVHGCKDRDEVKRIITLIDESDPVYRLCQMLASGQRSWEKIKPLLDNMDDGQINAAVAQLSGYIVKAMAGSKDDKQATRHWRLLEALTFPMESWNERVKLYTVVGRILWGGE
jgi:DNA polymerase III gamma/tau subunit